jgi:ATP-binding cassette, subfamily B, bacterial MsbA
VTTSYTSSYAVYKRLLSYTKPYRIAFVVALLSMVVAALTEPLFPALLKPLLDNGFVNKTGFPLWYIPAALIGMFLVRGVASFLSGYAMNWLANKMLIDLRTEMFAKMMRLPAEDFQRDASGLLISKIVFEVSNVTLAATKVVTVVIKDSLIVLSLLAWLLYLNWQLTLIVLVLVPLMALIVRAYSRRMHDLNRSSLEYTGELTRVVNEAVSGYKEIKVFGAYEQVEAGFRRTIDKLRSFAMRITIASGATAPITQLLASIAVACVVTIALLQTQRNETTVGGFVSFITAMLMLLAPLKHLADINEQLQRGIAAAEGVFELIDRASEKETSTQPLKRASGAIEFQGVSFRYAAAEQDALSNINLSIRPNEIVALVGESGGGKSTLISLIPRLLQPTSGKILIDGIDCAEISLMSLRQQMAIVSQDTMLFNESVRHNLCLGMTQAVSDETLWSILEAMELKDVVSQIPGQLDGSVGERGARFSGGQKQRLALARALLRDAPILILDEATSALDNVTESAVQRAIEKAMHGRTTIVVAHRLSTVEHADRILVMEQGQIIESGVHADLLAAQGRYAKLYGANLDRRG